MSCLVSTFLNISAMQHKYSMCIKTVKKNLVLNAIAKLLCSQKNKQVKNSRDGDCNFLRTATTKRAIFLNGLIPASFYFCLFNTLFNIIICQWLDSNCGVGSDHSTNWATTTVRANIFMLLSPMTLPSVLFDNPPFVISQLAVSFIVMINSSEILQ